MSLDLDKKCTDALKNATHGALKEVKVSNGMFINYRSAIEAFSSLDKILPSGQLGRKIQSYTCEDPLSDFLTSRLMDLVQDTCSYDANTEAVSLDSIPAFKSTEKLADAFIDQFDSLPWSYALNFEIPAKLAIKFYPVLEEPLTLSSHARLIRVDAFEIEQFIASNIYELSRFVPANRRITVEQLIANYNSIVDKCETDPSLKIELA